jgi:hypothetical protein
MNSYVQDVSKQSFYYLIKCHNHYGYISLENLSTWHPVYRKDKKGFTGKKQYELIEGRVSRSQLTPYMTKKLLKYKT